MPGRPDYTSPMPYVSPLRQRHSDYQDARADRGPAPPRPGAAEGVRVQPPQVEYVGWGHPGDVAACEVVATYGELESEYAAIRKGAGLFDSPHRGTLLIQGADRRDFLNRLLTQELKDLGPGSARQAFLLNRKGRIEADLLLAELGDRVVVDLDRHRAAATVEALEQFLFAEDVSIDDASDRFHHLAVHGPRARDAVAASGGAAGADLAPMAACSVSIAGAEVTVVRRDLTGEPGLELVVPRECCGEVWDALLQTDQTLCAGARRIRPVGWHALNIARVEAAVPLYMVDFGPDNLPHETGVLESRVSFTKGCYPGQEIVARTQNLGRPRQVLVGLRPTGDLLPEFGAEVRDESGAPVGVVTSSTLSPMLGAAPIALAMIKAAGAEPGTPVTIDAEGATTAAVVGPLHFAPHTGGAPS